MPNTAISQSPAESALQPHSRTRPDARAVRERWVSARTNDPEMPNARIASALGISEGMLLAACAGSKEGAVVAEAREVSSLDRVVALRPEWRRVLSAFPFLGWVRSVTENSVARLECIGEFLNFESAGPLAALTGYGLDLRLDLRAWKSAFAISSPGKNPAHPSRSIEFFDTEGNAVYRVYLTTASSLSAFWRIIWEYGERAPNPGWVPYPAVLPFVPSHLENTRASDAAKEALLDGWATLGDAREFPELLRQVGLTRAEAFTLAEGQFARRLKETSFPELLSGVVTAFAENALYVGNSACMQVYRGPLRFVAGRSYSKSVATPGSVLRCSEANIGAAWLVRLPREDAGEWSLELVDYAGTDAISVLPGTREADSRDSRLDLHFERIA